ncbi:MAG: hypothetical protein MUC68_06970 [Burkholderiaceae bacterium]|jgi:hypothetical protein|nr:hypothetical protein [Burkholderiaceae bacterium]
MPKLSHVTTNFTAGEITPKLYGRVDIESYPNSAKRLRNCVVMVQGGASRRPGTRFVAETGSGGTRKARLIGFVIDRSRSYCIEFGHLFVRFFTDGAPVLFLGLPYQLDSPYTEGELFDVRYAQIGDLMVLCHPNHPPRVLTWYGDTSWALTTAEFFPQPSDETGDYFGVTLTLSAATVGTGRTATAGAASFQPADVGRPLVSGRGLALITGFTSTTQVTVDILQAFDSVSISPNAWRITESPKTSITPSAKEPLFGACALNAAAGTWKSEHVGNQVLVNGGIVEITSIASATVANGRILVKLADVIAAPSEGWAMQQPAWSIINGWPRAVTVFEQRLIFGGSAAFPLTVWGSRTNSFFDFTLGSVDDDAFAFKIGADDASQIEHLNAIRQLLVLTYSGEYSMTGGTQRPITPTNVQVRPQSFHGASGTVRPIRTESEVLFAQRAGRQVRALGYRYDFDGFTAPDVSVRADHILSRGIVDFGLQRAPQPVVWVVLADGGLAACTYDRDQAVIAWTPCDTDGQVESVETVPAGDVDHTYLIVRRIINGSPQRFIERLDEDRETDSCVVQTSGTPFTVVSGLLHLNGKTVDVLADGVVQPPAVVSGGQITLARPATSAEVGLNYVSEWETLPLEVSAPLGSAIGANISVHKAFVRLLDTVGIRVNDQTVAFRELGPALLDRPVPRFTGDKEISTSGWQKSGGAIRVEQRQPYPATVLAIAKKVTVNDG